MSAYIVEDETINRIVAFLSGCHEEGKAWLFLPVQDLGYDLGSALHLKRLAEEMYTLNCQSVEERYGEGQSEEMSGGQAFVYRAFSPIRFNKVQALKSLACYLYQACEGGCDQSPLYQALESLRGKLAYEIVSGLPQYEAAQWG